LRARPTGTEHGNELIEGHLSTAFVKHETRQDEVGVVGREDDRQIQQIGEQLVRIKGPQSTGHLSVRGGLGA